MAGDLHTHSQYSDGSQIASGLPAMAAALALSTIAISDHDSILSVRYAHENPMQNGVKLIPATELTAYDPVNKHRVHLLVYYPDDCPALQAHCETMAQRRHAVHLQSSIEIEAIYPQYKTEQALQYVKESGVLYKCNIMTALRELGLANNVYGEEYHALFGSVPRGVVLHDIDYLPLSEVLETIRACRGVVVLAHPSVYKSMPLLRQLAADGLIDGVEIEHPRNTEADKAECRALVERYELIATGGTDFHGSYRKHPLPLATCTTSEDQIARIVALAKQRKA